MKKLLSLVLVIAALSLTFAFSSCKKDDGTIKIGVLQVDTHDALDSAREGFKSVVDEWAKKNGKKITYSLQNANGDTNNQTTIANTLVTSKCDLLFGISTGSAQALMGGTTKIPVLYTAVTDPVTAKLTAANVTGTSDLNPVAKQIQLISELVDDCDKIGFLYCSSEINSKLQVDLAIEECKKLGIAYQTFTAAASSDIQTVVESIPSSVKAVFIPTDNLFAANIENACGALAAKHIPAIVGESGMCQREGTGAATLGIDYFELGKQTGEMAIKILEGAKPADIKFEYYSKEPTFFINEANALKMGISQANIDKVKALYNK